MGQTITLSIIGENERHTSVIDSLGYKSSFLNYNSLETEVLSIKEQLFKIGFIDTVIKDISKVNDTIIEAHLNLGERVKRIKVFYDNTFDITLLDFLDIKRDSVFFELEITKLESSLRTLNTRIAEQGDPFSTLQLNDISKLDSSTLSAQLKIVTNQKRRIDNIVVKGYEKFPKSYISLFSKIKNRRIL